MKLSIVKWGNSAAVRLPAPMLAQLGAKIGDTFEADVSGEELVLRAAKPHYTLQELMAQCDLEAAPPKDLAEWAEMPAVGREDI